MLQAFNLKIKSHWLLYFPQGNFFSPSAFALFCVHFEQSVFLNSFYLALLSSCLGNVSFYYAPLPSIFCNLSMCPILSGQFYFVFSSLQFIFLTSFLPLGDTSECHPLPQPGRPPLLLLSRHFCVCSFLRSCLTLVLVLSVCTHTLCFVSTLYLCSPLTLLVPSLFIPPLTFCSCTDQAGPSRQWSRSQSPRVCQKIVCGG